MKLIDLYYEWKKKGNLGMHIGLCNAVPEEYEKTLKLFKPVMQELDPYDAEVFWASGLNRKHPGRYRQFTPLREAIVLSICAIHGEL